MYFALFWTFVYSYVYICNPAATLNESIKCKHIDLILSPYLYFALGWDVLILILEVYPVLAHTVLWRIIAYSIFCVEPFLRMKRDHLCQKRHQIQVFFWEQAQKPVLRSWRSVPICDIGSLSLDPRNRKSASGPVSRQSWRKRGSPHRWRRPEGLRTRHWPQLGLDGGKRTLLWSPPQGSPANRSAWRHGEVGLWENAQHPNSSVFKDVHLVDDREQATHNFHLPGW